MLWPQLTWRKYVLSTREKKQGKKNCGMKRDVASPLAPLILGTVQTVVRTCCAVLGQERKILVVGRQLDTKEWWCNIAKLSKKSSSLECCSYAQETSREECSPTKPKTCQLDSCWRILHIPMYRQKPPSLFFLFNAMFLFWSKEQRSFFYLLVSFLFLLNLKIPLCFKQFSQK